MTQAEAAEEFGTTAQRVSDAERGALPDRDIAELMSIAGYPDGVPSFAELCALARRRWRQPLSVVAEANGVSRVTYLERERAGDQDVVLFWRRRGFVFR